MTRFNNIVDIRCGPCRNPQARPLCLRTMRIGWPPPERITLPPIPLDRSSSARVSSTL